MKKTARNNPEKEQIEEIPEKTDEIKEKEKKIEETEEKIEEKDVKEDIVTSKEETTLEKSPEYSSFYEKVMGEKPRPSRIEEASVKKRISANTKLFFLGGFVFVLTVLLSSMIGLFLLNRGLLEKKTETTAIKETTITPSPTPIPFQREEWSFEVLNGSSTAGIAAKGAEKVKALGYKISMVGNADDSVDATELYVSKDATEAQKKLILEDLKKDFGELTIKDSLTDSEKTVRIILAQ